MKPHSMLSVKSNYNNADLYALKAWTGFALQGLLCPAVSTRPELTAAITTGTGCTAAQY